MKYYTSLLSGLLLALAFPPFPLYPLAFIAFIPILNAIEKQMVTKRKSLFIWFYLSFVIYHSISNWWISSFQEQTDPFLMASGFSLDILHPLFFLIPIFIYKHIRQNFGPRAIFSFPIIWTGWEYFHSLGEFSYPWLAVGNTQIYNFEWIQFIDITGVFGASFLITLINTLLYYSYLNVKNKRVKKRPGINRLPLLIIVVFIITPIFYGVLKIKKYDDINNEIIKIGLIQPNLNPWEKWSGGNVDQVRVLMSMQDSLIKSGNRIDFGLWPETSILSISRSFNSDLKLSFLQRWVNNGNSIISGFVHRKPYMKGEEPSVTANLSYDSIWFEHYNAAITVNPNKSPQVYHKSKLTPFAERIPNIENASFLLEYLTWGVGISSWGLGDGPHTTTVFRDHDSLKVGTIICIESIYPEFCRNFANQGAEFLTIITNDAWYDGTPGPEQHFQIARIRAIENRRFVARVGNSGVSGIISASGKEMLRMPAMEKTAAVGDVSILKEKSIYTEFGDNLLARPMMYCAILLWLMSLYKRFISK